ncbi:hypothetical protein AB0L57_08655 [Nocardia sp. NPDC052254]|uniref:Rv0361 family membrane protein n=1 Tax=Nocardia sp. NPDC052254 TaxID=3155681 RepID=UPI0034328C20
MSDPNDDQKPRQGADGDRPTKPAQQGGSTPGTNGPDSTGAADGGGDAGQTQRISRDQLPGASTPSAKTQVIRVSGADSTDAPKQADTGAGASGSGKAGSEKTDKTDAPQSAGGAEESAGRKPGAAAPGASGKASAATSSAASGEAETVAIPKTSKPDRDAADSGGSAGVGSPETDTTKPGADPAPGKNAASEKASEPGRTAPAGGAKDSGKTVESDTAAGSGATTATGNKTDSNAPKSEKTDVAGAAAAAGTGAAAAATPDAPAASAKDASPATDATAAGDSETVALPKVSASSGEESTQKLAAPKPAPDSGDSGDRKQSPAQQQVPSISNPSDEATTVLPIQRPDQAATEKLRKAPAQQGPGGQAGPPNRPGPNGPAGPGQQGPQGRPAGSAAAAAGLGAATGPKGPGGPVGGPGPAGRGPGQQGPLGGPGQPGPQGPNGPAPQRPGGAPSPADIKMTTPAQPVTPQQGAPQPMPPRPVAQPQRVPAADPAAAGAVPGRNNRRVLVIAGAVVVVIIAIVAVIAFTTGGSDNSPEAKVKGAVSTYTDALASGKLTDLQSSTCGKLHEFYQNIASDQYAGVHKLAADQKKIPKVASVEAVQITGDKAVAQVNVYTDADPSRSTARTFDLQQTDGGWKVCDPEVATQ